MDCLPAFINNHKLGQICQTRRDTVSMESRLGAAQIKVYHNISSITLSDERCGHRLVTICRYMAHDNRPADLLWPQRGLRPPALHKQTGGEQCKLLHNITYPSWHIWEICTTWQKRKYATIGDTPLSSLVAHSNNDENKTGFYSFSDQTCNDGIAMLGWLLMCSECFQHFVMRLLKCLVARWFLRWSKIRFAHAKVF